MKRTLGRTAIPAISTWLVALTFVASGCMAPPPASPAPGQGSAPLPDTATSTPATPAAAPTHAPTPAAIVTTTATSTLTYQAQVDFGKPVGDAYLQTLLDKHGAEIVVAYMTTTGFFGAHRGATPTDPKTFIAQARAETLAMFSSGAGGGITTRAKDFVGNHTTQDLDADTETLKRARSLLDMHSQLESARSDAAGDAPLIHAVEVHGSESQLQLLGQEDGVVGFEIAPVGSQQAHWSRPPLTDVATGQIAPTSAAGTTVVVLTSQELYDQLSTLAER